MTARELADDRDPVVRAPTPAIKALAPGTADQKAHAFQQLARLHLEAAYGLARAILGDAAEAEDATHDAIVTAWQHWSTLRNPQSFAAWFDRILVNTCRNRLRRRSRWRIIDISEELGLQRADPSIEAVDDRQRLGVAIRRLAPDDRVVLALRFYMDLSVDDIGRRLGIRSGTVKSRLHHALRRLRAELARAGDPEAIR